MSRADLDLYLDHHKNIDITKLSGEDLVDLMVQASFFFHKNWNAWTDKNRQRIIQGVLKDLKLTGR